MYGKYSEIYEEWSRCYDPGNLELSLIQKYVNIENKNILEIGCGTGRLTSKLSLKAKKIVAIDNDSESLEVAKRKHNNENISYILCDVLDVDKFFYKSMFDIVIFSWSLNYIKDICKALRNAREVLHEGGEVLILYTDLGEYESIMQSVVKNGEISNTGYLNMRSNFKKIFKIKAEDKINLPFVFKNVEQAIRLNSFFFEMEDASNLESMISCFKEKISVLKKEDGTIIILDTVDLLLGGIHNV